MSLQKTTSTSRITSVDVVRGCAIIAMLQAHLWAQYVTLDAGTATGSLPAYLLSSLFVSPLAGFAAPLFVMLSGLSSSLSPSSRRRDGRDRSIRRGLALFALATAVNVVSGSLLHVVDISILNWGVIQLIGFCICLLPIFRALDTKMKLLWCLAPLLVSELAPSSLIASVPPLFSGFAPVCPWATLFFAGAIMGQTYASAILTRSRRKLAVMGALGFLLVWPIGLGVGAPTRAFSWEHLAQLSWASEAVFVGSFVILMAVSGYLLDHLAVRSSVVSALAGLGQHALTVYYVQLFGVVLSPLLFVYLFGYSPRFEWYWFPPLLVGLVSLLYFLVDHVWARYDYALSLEWFLARLVSQRAVQHA